MIKRTIEISDSPSHLAVRDGQLLILRKHEPPARLPANPPNLAGSVPCEDVGLIIIDERDTTYSHHALAALMEAGAAVVICGRDHQPSGFLLPYPTHNQVVWRIDRQVRLGKVLRKQLWSQIVQAKVRAQAALLDHAPEVQSKLLALARSVRSGDPENIESQAARAYWSVWLTPDDVTRLPTRPGSRFVFRREPGGVSLLNDLLDYGYAVLRAAVARAIVSAGMLPALGIKHSNRSNAFCLADDLIEPLRPMVDARVRKLIRKGWYELARTTKAELLTLLTVRSTTTPKSDTDAAAEGGPLMVALHRYAASLAACLDESSAGKGGSGGMLDIPEVSVVDAESHQGDWRIGGRLNASDTRGESSTGALPVAACDDDPPGRNHTVARDARRDPERSTPRSKRGGPSGSRDDEQGSAPKGLFGHEREH